MAGDALIYAAAIVVSLWGVAHLIPTRSVVAGFGGISLDNRRVLTMEWVAEGLTLLFVGALVAAVTLSAGADDAVVVLVYRMAAGLLAGIAVLTALTGARTPVGWLKARPLVLASVIALLLVSTAAARACSVRRPTSGTNDALGLHAHGQRPEGGLNTRTASGEVRARIRVPADVCATRVRDARRAHEDWRNDD